jgi:hypothetical protein
MPISEILRARLQKELQEASVYKVAKDSRVGWAALKRFSEGYGMRFEQIDLLCEYFGLTLVDTKKPKSKQ